MPFSALLAGTDTIVSHLVEDHAPIILHPHSSFECKACHGAMRVVRAVMSLTVVQRRAHFRHVERDDRASCPMALYEAAETPEHIQLKELFANNLAAYIPVLKSDPVAVIETERWLPFCGANGRIADVYFETQSERRAAIEVQLSPISVEQLDERCDDYLRQEITPFWAFDPGRLTAEHRRVLDRRGLDRLILVQEKGGRYESTF